MIATMLGVSEKCAVARYRGHADNERARRIWSEHGPEALALIDLLLEEGAPASVLTVYLVLIQRRLASMSPDPGIKAEIREALAEAFPAPDQVGASADVTEPDVPAACRPRRAGLSRIIHRISVETGLGATLILGPEQRREVVLARDYFAWAAHAAGYTLAEIGAYANGRDHSSMSAARRRHERRQACPIGAA